MAEALASVAQSNARPTGDQEGLKTLLQQGISESEFYGELMCRFKNMWENLTFWSIAKK